jgi:hypothetical protein
LLKNKKCASIGAGIQKNVILDKIKKLAKGDMNEK